MTEDLIQVFAKMNADRTCPIKHWLFELWIEKDKGSKKTKTPTQCGPVGGGAGTEEDEQNRPIDSGDANPSEETQGTHSVLAAVTAGMSVGCNFHDYSMCTFVRDKVSFRFRIVDGLFALSLANFFAPPCSARLWPRFDQDSC